MTLQQLKYVIAVADKGTISEAAKSLYISQPSLTNAIRELEKELKITIFHRTNRGIDLSLDGIEFLGYARQVVEQSELLEEKYLGNNHTRQHFQVSAQHYSFVVNAFVELIKNYGNEEYDLTLRETRTIEIIEDVKHLRSELGVLYLNDFNEKVLMKYIQENHLVFYDLFVARPHVFISAKHPLAAKSGITLDDLANYPHLSFEQGEYNSFYFSEEILSTIPRRKMIKVSDRATLFNLLIGLNGYTICTGIISEQLNGKNIVARPLEVDDNIRIGYIMREDVTLSHLAATYLQILENQVYADHTVSIENLTHGMLEKREDEDL